jgi:hypothetical protein
VVKNRHFIEKIPTCEDDLRVSAASGGERGFRKGLTAFSE